MLTLDFDLWGIEPGELVLDIGCGRGRHSFEALRRGAGVIAAALDASALNDVRATCAGMEQARELDAHAPVACVRASLLELPFDDGVFDRVIASEVLEHVLEDDVAMREIARVLRPGGKAVVTVPRWWPERVCWGLSNEYHSNDGGHVRIYRARQLKRALQTAGLAASSWHHAHSLHTPYWWLRCLCGVSNTEAVFPRLYHRFLVRDLTARRRWVQRLDAILNPVLGKSLVVYLEKEPNDSSGADHTSDAATWSRALEPVMS